MEKATEPQKTVPVLLTWLRMTWGRPQTREPTHPPKASRTPTHHFHPGLPSVPVVADNKLQGSSVFPAQKKLVQFISSLFKFNKGDLVSPLIWQDITKLKL